MTWIVDGFDSAGLDVVPRSFRTQTEASTYAKTLKEGDRDVYLNMYFMEDANPEPRSRWERLMGDDDFLE